MAEHYRTQGFVLQKRDVGEVDRIFTIFTKDFGKLRLRAISERKIASKLRGGLEAFCLSDIEFIEGKARRTLIDATATNAHIHIKKDLRKLSVAWRIAEVIDEAVRGQEPDEKIWELLQEVFSFLEREHASPKGIKLVTYYFLWNLLSRSGYEPRLADFPEVAGVIETFLQKDVGEAVRVLEHTEFQKDLLKKVSYDYLSRVLEN